MITDKITTSYTKGVDYSNVLRVVAGKNIVMKVIQIV